MKLSTVTVRAANKPKKTVQFYCAFYEKLPKKISETTQPFAEKPQPATISNTWKVALGTDQFFWERQQLDYLETEQQ